MQHSLSAKPCGETPRVAEHHSTQPYTILYPSVAKSYRIVEHTHHSVTSIPGSTGRTPPALSLQGGWSLSHCGFDATRAGL